MSLNPKVTEEQAKRGAKRDADGNVVKWDLRGLWITELPESECPLYSLPLVIVLCQFDLHSLNALHRVVAPPLSDWIRLAEWLRKLTCPFCRHRELHSPPEIGL